MLLALLPPSRGCERCALATSSAGLDEGAQRY